MLFESRYAPGDDIERLMNGWSIVHCVPVSLAESPSAAIGSVIRADVMRELTGAAGFARVDVPEGRNDSSSGRS